METSSRLALFLVIAAGITVAVGCRGDRSGGNSSVPVAAVSAPAPAGQLGAVPLPPDIARQQAAVTARLKAAAQAKH